MIKWNLVAEAHGWQLYAQHVLQVQLTHLQRPCYLQYKLVHISVGDLLREEVKQGTPAGKKAHEFMDRGALVPDEVVVEMVQHRLSQPDVQEHGWLLDGYPRSASQAEAIEKEGIKPDVFLLIEVSSSCAACATCVYRDP